jgi:transcriptional regulator with XRE-family HTH domain
MSNPDAATAAANLARNLKQLREARGLSQAQAAKLAGVPRPTWGNLETGAANPTLQVLWKVAHALRVSLEEVLAAPRQDCRLYRAEELGFQTKGDAAVRKLLPEPLPGLEIERLEIPPGGVMVGSPHTAGTREYLTCERGKVVLAAAGDSWTLAPGDVMVFPGNQKHSYRNPGKSIAVAYSAVLLAPA